MNLPTKKHGHCCIAAATVLIVILTFCCGASFFNEDEVAYAGMPTVKTAQVSESQLVEDPLEPIAISEAVAAPASDEVEVILEETTTAKTNVEEVEAPTLDRNKPIYEVYKNGWSVQVPTDLQWYIRDMCEKYNFPEKPIYGMILCESTFDPNAYNSGCYGLCQINKFWIRGAAIEHFTDDYASRDLYNPYHNILTLMEMWCYARDTYGLDPYNNTDMVKLLYWHNTGKDPRNVSNWAYATRALGYADELVLLQG